MENILEQKPQGKFKGWALAGIITSLLFMVTAVVFELYFYNLATTVYQTQLGAADYASIFISSNGLFQTALFIFFIGLFASRKRGSFVKFMLWTMMLLDFYFAMPAITGAISLFWSYSGIELLYYFGLYIPQILAGVLLAAFIIQKDSEKKNAVNTLAWVSVIADAFLFIFQVVSASTSGAVDFTTAVYSFSGGIAISSLFCLSVVILLATKANKTGTLNAPKEKKKETMLEDLVEKIAQEVSKNDEDLVEKVAPDED
jgi:hypothetical protein